MKKIWIYLLGILSGVILTFVAFAIIGGIMNVKNDPASRVSNGMSFFEKPGDVIEEQSFKVFQALGDGAALAEGKGDGYYLGLNVLLYNEEGNPYYDEQIITAPSGKCFRQIGIYRYRTRSGLDKTIPINP